MKNINILLLNFFMIIYPWGRFFDKLIFGDIGVGAKGISTALLILIIFVSVLNGSMIKGLYKVPNKIFLLIFLVLTLFSTALSNTPEKLYSDFINLLIYFLIIFIIVGINPTSSQIRKFIGLLFFSTFLMSLFSLLDFWNYINIPFFNEGVSNVRIGESIIFDLTGPFRIRTDIAFHLALISIIPIIFLFSKKLSFLKGLIYGTIFITLIITSYFTNSRSLFLVLAFCLFYFTTIIFNYKRKANLIFSFFTLFIVLVSLSDNFSFIDFKGDSTLLSRSVGGESDMIRFYTFETTISDIIKSPFGAGLDMPFLKKFNQYKDVHSSYTYLLRAGGFIGFFSLMFFLKPLLKKIVKFKVSYSESFFIIPIISLLIFGFFHTSIQFTTFWIFVAFAYTTIYNKNSHN